MRLIDLQPKWLGLSGHYWGRPGNHCYYGIRFICPHCNSQNIGVCFKPFIDPSNLAALVPWAIPGSPDPNTGIYKPMLWWNCTGDTFDNLTLSPSVDTSGVGHRHGNIINGGLL